MGVWTEQWITDYLCGSVKMIVVVLDSLVIVVL